MSRLLLTAALCSLILSLAGPAAAYEISKAQSSGKELRWTSLPMKFNIENGSLKGLSASQCQSAIRAAYKAWADVSCSVFTTKDQGVVGASTNNTKDHVNTHTFPSNWIGSYPQNALAFTRTSYDPTSGKILDADVLYNPKHTWSSSGSFYAYDMQSVATHEIGHEMGFGHSQHATASMYYVTPNGATHQRSLHSDDIAAACHSYGNGSQLPPECTTASHCATGESCNAGKCVKGAVTKKAYGATCASSNECSSDLCIQSGGKGLCSQVCGSSSCPASDSCVGLSGGGKACLPGTGAAAQGLGTTCTSSIGCKSNYCVTLSGKSLCTQKCNVTSQNCPNGFMCTGTSIGGLCVAGNKPGQTPPKPQTPTQKLGDKCTASKECKSGLCGKTKAGNVCVILCDRSKTNSCPTGFMCEAMVDNNKGACVKGSGNPGNPGGNQNPPPTGNTKGKLGAKCNNNSACNSGICAVDSSNGTYFCSRLCDPAKGCGQGFACVFAGAGKYACKPGTSKAPGGNAGPGGDPSYEEVGCSVASSSKGSDLTGALALIFLLPVLMLWRGRRRRS